MEETSFYKTIMNGIYEIYGYELGCEEDGVCLCDERYYWGPKLKNTNFFIRVNTMSQAEFLDDEALDDEELDFEELHERSATIIELVYVDDLNAEAYGIYVGTPQPKIAEQMIVKEIVEVISKESLEDSKEIMKEICFRYMLTKEIKNKHNARDIREFFAERFKKIIHAYEKLTV